MTFLPMIQTDDRPLQRIQGEYREMPGLLLTTRQAAVLCGLTVEQCCSLLEDLVARGFLRKKGERFGRADVG